MTKSHRNAKNKSKTLKNTKKKRKFSNKKSNARLKKLQRRRHKMFVIRPNSKRQKENMANNAEYF